MHITRVRARDVRQNGKADRVSGVLLLETETGQICLNVTAPAQEPRQDGLWLDALRQLQRLPEFRHDVTRITLAAFALDGMCAEA